MSRLPEPGEVAAAIELFNERVAAAVGEPDEPGGTVWTGPTVVHEDARMVGEGASPTYMVYGDLFVPGEVVRGPALGLAQENLRQLGLGHDLRSVLIGTYLQGAALGVLMERQRWERPADEDGADEAE